MEFTVNRSDLVRELNLLKGSVEAKTTIPVLGNVLIVAEGDSIQLATTNLELAMRCSCSANVKKPGRTTLPAKRLLDYVKLLPDEDVQIQVKIGENHWASLTCGRSKARIAGMAADSFPELPVAPPTSAAFPVATLAGMIAKSAYAVNKEPTRYTLNGGQFRIAEAGLSIATTDGHRLVWVDVIADNAGKETVVLLPLSAMGEITKLAADEEALAVAMQYSEDDNHIFVTVGKRQLITRKLSGNFPDVARVIPKDLDKVATINREEMKAALERVAQFSNEKTRAIKLSLSNGEVSFSAAVAGTGESEEGVAAVYDGESVEIGFNAAYLIDFLRAMASQEVTLALKDSISAGMMKPVGEDGVLCVIMPMRI